MDNSSFTLKSDNPGQLLQTFLYSVYVAKGMNQAATFIKPWLRCLHFTLCFYVLQTQIIAPVSPCKQRTLEPGVCLDFILMTQSICTLGLPCLYLSFPHIVMCGHYSPLTQPSCTCGLSHIRNLAFPKENPESYLFVCLFVYSWHQGQRPLAQASSIKLIHSER